MMMTVSCMISCFFYPVNYYTCDPGFKLFLSVVLYCMSIFYYFKMSPKIKPEIQRGSIMVRLKTGLSIYLFSYLVCTFLYRRQIRHISYICVDLMDRTGFTSLNFFYVMCHLSLFFLVFVIPI